MKKLLLIISLVAASGLSYAQCNPDYDFTGVEYGVSPDPEQGETFTDGAVGLAYADTIHLLAPTDAGSVDPLYAGVPIDSISLLSVSLTLDGTTYTPQELGLDFACNNAGVSEDPCTIQGGLQGCGSIYGTPTAPGLYNLVVTVQVYATIFGNVISLPFEYEGYTLFIDGIINVSHLSGANFDVAQNKPNPFNKITYVDFELASAGTVKLTVLNLLGSVVYEENINGLRGKNTLKMNAADFQPGVYLYRLQQGTVTATYRMVVSR